MMNCPECEAEVEQPSGCYCTGCLRLACKNPDCPGVKVRESITPYELYKLWPTIKQATAAKLKLVEDPDLGYQIRRKLSALLSELGIDDT